MAFRVASVWVRYGSVRVNSDFSDSLSGEHILNVGSDIDPGRSVRISNLGSVLSGLILFSYTRSP